ncbi:MAG: nuclear transport factor 2 family protein [Parvularcula sp.]|jgi:ketosteroid isomerase-like protein|nr:nuclear transport factor 2 family protein [Parvularcula sp.]
MTITATPATDLHRVYVEAINSNDTDRILELMSEDIVFQVPGEPELVGKEALAAWANGFFAAFEASWDKTERALEQSGDLAISRYTYAARFRSHEDGSESTEIGKGTCIYRREPTGKWVMLIDSWSTHEVPAEEH